MTLMFSGIVGFGQYCAANTDAEGAMKIVKILNELYTIFDSLTDSKHNSNIYKVRPSFLLAWRLKGIKEFLLTFPKFGRIAKKYYRNHKI